MEKVHETVLEIDLNALKENFQYLKTRVKPKTKILAVVKAFAYGSSSVEIAQYLENLDIDYFAVAYTHEGIALREAGVKTPILVLHPQSMNFKTLIEHALEPSLYSHFVLNEFIKVAHTEKQSNYPVHIKFNTGLNRLGFESDDVSDVVSILKNTSSILAKSLFSHLAASEDFNEKEFTEKQIQTFKDISEEFTESIGFKPILHLCNTSGILNYPEAHFDMVRSGIGLYGFGNSDLEDQHFTPIATLKSIISQIHTIKKGDSVGYNRAFIANKQTKIATIPVGHADGIGRQYGNGKGFVTINNKQAPIIGNVCMDMIMIDISDINCQEGDEVIIFGKNPTANAFALATTSISYEIITAISQRVKRVFLK
ncbi:alanine racemase [Bizionia argentinensis JUB59]|uniref:Alanine racemase n=1 Tax=Bizionia argentinensis JUB59 TaxID=1046627 RepID=G2EEJ9_9FLAO|nr:alanine racemase [Bizionia argentinensis]EGV43191.1 alanine racemase [Bizionia argentinensis JUB59]